MSAKTFAAIDLGSFEMAMKIYEISKNGMKEIDYVRHRLSLGSDSYNTGKISYRKIDELCRELIKFGEIMETYNVTDYKVYGTSALRETDNTVIIQDQIRSRTGFEIDVLSNSEQRFLDYKSVASKGNEFNKIIEESSAIIDIGGGNLQVSLFENDSLVSTHELELGVLKIRDRIQSSEHSNSQLNEILTDHIDSSLNVFKKVVLKDREISNLIIVDDYISRIVKAGAVKCASNGIILADDFMILSEYLCTTPLEVISDEYSVTEEMAELLMIASKLITRLINLTDAKKLWIPGVTLCDGIAYEFAEKKKLKIIAHDFEKDILDAAVNISKRYMGSKKRSAALSSIALTLFDSVKKVHGMGKRERFLLQLSVILHDCGKFINLTRVGECSYNIIMNTEMIGLSHVEREIVANVVKYYYESFDDYEKLSLTTMLDKDAYLIVAKLTAILRVAGNLDRGSKQKIPKIKADVIDEKLVIYLADEPGILFFKDAFERSAEFFGEVYSIEPVISFKKMD